MKSISPLLLHNLFYLKFFLKKKNYVVSTDFEHKKFFMKTRKTIYW